MTAMPDQFAFESASEKKAAPVFLRPQIKETYWGYDISMNEQILDMSVAARFAAAFLTVAFLGAALGVWLLPAMSFAADAVMSKAVISGCLAGSGAILARYAGRSTRVRVQIDTSSGEIREVVSGAFGATIVLADYGMDAVKGVDVVASPKDTDLGQVQLRLSTGDVIAIGDGSVPALSALRDRLTVDCGLAGQALPREAVWSGPLSPHAA